MNVGRSIVMVFVLAVMSAFAPWSMADDKPSEAAGRVSAATVYLRQAVEGFHQITVVGALGGSAVLILDPNTCTVNEFGDRQACTRIAPLVANVTLTDTQKPDPANLGRALYSIDGSPTQNPLYLMTWPSGDRPPRLVYVDRGPDTPRPITLEPLVYGGNVAPRTATAGNVALELCRGSYSASQVPGAVILFASGVHPTAGYQQFFEPLPITVFPPEFRLVHIKPTGPAAQVISPFQVMTTFPAEERIERVIVHDEAGAHEVPVEQVPDVK